MEIEPKKADYNSNLSEVSTGGGASRQAFPGWSLGTKLKGPTGFAFAIHILA